MIDRIDCRTVDVIVKGVRYIHPNAKRTDTCYDGCCDYYKCPDCGTTWREELPE